jgi:hypothetical protein
MTEQELKAISERLIEDASQELEAIKAVLEDSRRRLDRAQSRPAPAKSKTSARTN